MNLPYPTDIRPLTSLRFFAALAVVFHHIGYFMPSPVPWAAGFFQKGYLGVDFFFILSGFILTHVYADSLRTGVCTVRDFYVRRFARIYPLHLLTLLVMAGMFYTRLGFGFVGDMPAAFPVKTFFDHLLMIHAWGTEQTLRLNAPSWSISAEWLAYLLFPLLIAGLPRFHPRNLVCAAAILFAAMWLISVMINPERPLTKLSTDFGIVRIFPEFALGMALYLFFRQRAGVSHAGRWLALCAAGIAALMYAHAPDIIIVSLFAAIIVLAADLSRSGGGWLSGPFCVWLGEISYAVYMTHYIVLTVILWGAWQALAQADFLAIFPLLAAASVATTVGISAISYHALEKPARRWITKTLTP